MSDIIIDMCGLPEAKASLCSYIVKLASLHVWLLKLHLWLFPQTAHIISVINTAVGTLLPAKALGKDTR